MIADLKPYAEYKESSAPWFGEVPAHWNVKRLGSVFAERGETNENREVVDILSVLKHRGVIPYAEKGRIGNKASDDIGRYKIVRPDDLVVNCMNVIIGSLGRSRYTGCLSPVYYVLRRRDERNDPRYLELVFQHKQFHESLIRIGNGILAHRMRIPMEKLKSEMIPLPPSAEQAAIVRFLDWATGQLDRAIRAKRKVIALLNEQKQAIIHRAVTRGLDPSVPLKDSGVPWLGEIPEHWEVKKLRFLFRYAKGSRAAELTNEYIGRNAGEFPVFSGQTEHDGLMGEISWHEFDFDSPVVFVSTVGARAMTTRILSGKFSLSQNCALIVPRNRQGNPLYFENVFQRLFAFERYSISQIMQPSLRFSDLNRFYVPHPPVEEQLAIAAEIAREIGKLNTAICRLEREITLLREYRTRLIADVVTGKLDVRAAAAALPNEEPFDDFAGLHEPESNLDDEMTVEGINE